jgi:hypothetical protein
MSSRGDTADRTGGALPSADLDQPVAINVEERLGLGALELIESAQARWLAVNAPHLVALVRAGARFENGKLVERPDESGGEAQVA